MAQAARKLAFEEYVNLDAEDWVKLGLPEGRCEYFDGELVELPSESRLNLLIANYLLLALVNAGIPLNLVYTHACEIEVSGKPRTRYPDLVVLREEHLKPTERRAMVTLKMLPPQLVAELVSPVDANHRRDYEAKRNQYQERGIPEYWLLNPETETIEVLELKNGKYVEFGTFQGSTPIQSPNLKALTFTAEQVFSAGRQTNS